MLDLSVIIVTRNTCSLTCAAIQSVLDARDDLSKEVLLVDNGSTDGTLAEVAGEFPSVVAIRSENNLGFARANNLAACKAQGRFLLLLNSDAEVKPDALGAAVAWMREHPDCGVAGAQLVNADGSLQNSIANFPTLATELLNKSLLRRLFPRRYPGKEQRFTDPVEVETIVGAFMLIRRETWDALGGLDERYFFFLEETDFCFHARRRGWRVMHLPHIRVAHGQGRSARQVRPEARIEYWRSRYIYFAKNHRPAARRLLAAGLAVRLLVDWLSSGLITLLTLGRNEKWKERLRVHTALLRWHLRGQPQDVGLPR
ncbi:MAG: glycosyltransferase family 2 protein [Verrucomicrobia bacterium]|nr:glycosyltransferase family 2 protein [Verrucomicrobiota bacterium]